MMTIQDLLDLSKTIAAPLFAGKTYPWEALAEIGDFILQLGPTLPAEEYEQRGENIWIARDAKIFDSAYIAGPCIIDHRAELRQCARQCDRGQERRRRQLLRAEKRRPVR